jgi:hypothetical protein
MIASVLAAAGSIGSLVASADLGSRLCQPGPRTGQLGKWVVASDGNGRIRQVGMGAFRTQSGHQMAGDAGRFGRMTLGRDFRAGEAGRMWRNCVVSDTTIQHLDDPVAAAYRLQLVGIEQEARARRLTRINSKTSPWDF